MEGIITNDWTTVAALADVSDGKPTIADAGGAPIAIFTVGGEYFAVSNLCTHLYAPLTGGKLDGFVIVCPIHAGRFDIRDGTCQGGPVDVDLASYDVRVADGMIEVRLRT